MEPKNEISLFEPPPGIETGILSALWRGQEKLPPMSRLELVSYFLQRGLQALLALPMSTTITTMTIAISLFLYGSSLLFYRNTEMALSEAGGRLELTVYLKENTPDAAIQTFLQKLRSNPTIRSANFVSKNQALELFRKDLGSQGSFLSGLAEDNPLPSSIDVILQPDELGIQRLENIIQSIREDKIVEEAIYGGEWVEQVHNLLEVFRVFGLIVLFTVFAIIVFLIANTMRLVIYSRREEIAIMQLVGASQGFIRIPFLVGGFIQGFVGSLVGIILLRLAFSLLQVQWTNVPLLHVLLPQLAFLSTAGVFMILSLGTVIGIGGSLFALGRFMKG